MLHVFQILFCTLGLISLFGYIIFNVLTWGNEPKVNSVEIAAFRKRKKTYKIIAQMLFYWAIGSAAMAFGLFRLSTVL